METYRLQVILDLEVEAFDKDDAEIVVTDYLGPGPMDEIIMIRKMLVKHL